MYENGSLQGGVAVTPSDATPISCNRVWVGGVGNLVVTMQDGQILTFTAVPAGTMLPISVTRIRAATTATLILALY
jgi:hypothetical protein